MRRSTNKSRCGDFFSFFNPLFILNIGIGKRLFLLSVQLQVTSRFARVFNMRIQLYPLCLNFNNSSKRQCLKLTIKFMYNKLIMVMVNNKFGFGLDRCLLVSTNAAKKHRQREGKEKKGKERRME